MAEWTKTIEVGWLSGRKRQSWRFIQGVVAQATVGPNPTAIVMTNRGGMAEWTKTAVLAFHTGRCGASHRGSESYSHRHYK